MMVVSSPEGPEVIVGLEEAWKDFVGKVGSPDLGMAR